MVFIIDHLLTERTEQSAIAFPGAGRAGGLTDGHLALAAPGAFCRGRAAVAQAVSAGVAPQLLVAYSPRGGPGAKVVADHELSGAGCLLVWDLKAPEAPRQGRRRLELWSENRPWNDASECIPDSAAGPEGTQAAVGAEAVEVGGRIALSALCPAAHIQ